MGIFQVVSFLESEFGIEVGDEDLVPDNFGTIDLIAALVESKQGS
jgi:acyl carrier protein